MGFMGLLMAHYGGLQGILSGRIKPTVQSTEPGLLLRAAPAGDRKV